MLILSVIATWIAVSQLWGHAIETDSYRRRAMLVTLGVLVLMSFVVLAVASLFFAGGGYSGPNVVSR